MESVFSFFGEQQEDRILGRSWRKIGQEWDMAQGGVGAEKIPSRKGIEILQCEQNCL